MRPLDPAALLSALFRLLRRHPVEALALCLVGALLAAVAPILQAQVTEPQAPIAFGAVLENVSHMSVTFSAGHFGSNTWS